MVWKEAIYLCLQRKMDEDISVSVLNTSLSFNFNVEIDNEGQKYVQNTIWFVSIYTYSLESCFMFYNDINHCCSKDANFAEISW